MKLPSLRQAYQDAQITFQRFPVVIIVAVLGTAAAILLVDHEGPSEPSVFFNIFFASVLGIPLLTTLVLVAERKGLAKRGTLGLQLVGLLLLAGYAFTLPTDFMHAPLVPVWRFFILAIALHLFASVAPYASRGEWNGFWHYNKTLLLRVLTALLYSLVLYAGLSLALAALDNLFGVDVPGKRYLELWILVTGMFATWFFLAGIPEKLAQLETLSDYPRSLKIFAQYILLPIVLIYFVILYAYLAKIVIAWDWPQGWVSKLILGFSAAGMFLLLLLHPITRQAGSLWIKKFARWFYIALIPLIVMLFLAVWRRVGEYGITEGRYLAIVLGAWLCFLVVYFTAGKTKSIKVIPLSLCVLAFAVSFGPWSAFSMARQSQIGRLEQLLSNSGLLVEGKIQPASKEIPYAQARQISALLSYLHESHGFEGIQPWFTRSLREYPDSTNIAYKNPETVARMMNFHYVTNWAASPEGIVTLGAADAFDPRGYDRMAPLQMFWRENDRFEFPSDGIAYRMSRERDTITFSTLRESRVLLKISLLSPAEELLKKYRDTGTDRLPNEALAIVAAGNGLRVKICPSQIDVREKNGRTSLVFIHGIVLYSLEHPLAETTAARDSMMNSHH